MGDNWYCEQAAGTCRCRPACTGRCCGDDGCGGTCPDGCASGEVCKADTCLCEQSGVCTPGEARCDGDVARVCEADGWTDVQDCEQSGQVCLQGSCQAKSCTTREDCAGPVCLTCRSGKCVEPPEVCRGNQDCCVNMYCSFGACMFEGPGCQDDNDCAAIDPEYPVCRDGVCVHECEDDLECPVGAVCVDFHCMAPGCTPQSCDHEVGYGYYCDMDSGECLPGCDSNDDCISPETCDYESHECSHGDCCSGICDPENEYCESLTCLCVAMCTSGSDCPTGFDCDTGSGRCLCTEASCPAGTHCDETSGSCVPDQTGECEIDEDCPEGEICDLFSLTCRRSGSGTDGDPCYTDGECDQAEGYYCDSSLFCIGCMLTDPNFAPTYTCRAECSMFLDECPNNYQCLYRHSGMIFLCIPDALLP
ncbi:MAG: hypothetical protein JXR96_21850 [Deltaproteobacteria bacterium]|nr:hypothetical protein [Deltaproteobacteria bacterium]